MATIDCGKMKYKSKYIGNKRTMPNIKIRKGKKRKEEVRLRMKEA